MNKKFILGGALLVFGAYYLFMNNKGSRKRGHRGKHGKHHGKHGSDNVGETIADSKMDNPNDESISGKSVTIPPQRVSNFSGDGDFFNFDSEKNWVVGDYSETREQTYIYPEGNYPEGYYVKGRVNYPKGTIFSF